MVGGIVVHPGIQPQNGFALAAGSVLGKDHHFAGQPLARPGGIDGQGVDDGHLVVIGRGGPAAVLVFRQLISVEVHAAPDGAVLVHAYIQRPGLENAPGGVGGGVGAPLPAGVVGAGGVLLVQNGLINGGHGGEVGFLRTSDHGQTPFGSEEQAR